jgi:NAD(P)H-dependent FMN reductase
VHTLRVLAICGSLRRQSNNAILLRAAARLTTGDASLHLYSEAGALPLFNADL